MISLHRSKTTSTYDHCVERSRVLQVMDKIAYVPGLNTGIGTLRMALCLTGLAMALIVQIGATCCGDKTKKTLDDKLIFWKVRCCQELQRGFIEFVPLLPLTAILDSEFEDDHDVVHGRYL